MFSNALPVDHIFSDLKTALVKEPRLILQAAPGAGKSTRLPLNLLLNAGNSTGKFSPQNRIIMLEPRRVAARQISEFLAKQLGEKVGQSVGLAMRGENKTSNKTILTVVTDGVLVKMLQQDPELSGVGLLIFDEFHERALSSDLALALSLDCQQLNENITIMIMSATIDTASLSEQLNAPVITAEGRQFPIEYEYCPSELIPTHHDICRAIQYATEQTTSSILVFLPGMSDIIKVANSLEFDDDNISVLPLYGGLPLAEQVAAIEPIASPRRKIVLATNIAQTSLTIEGVDTVIDCGLEKVSIYQPRIGTDILTTQFISKAAAEQRAGRAGRLRPGKCFRLGSAEHWQRRTAYDVADIERSDLSQLLMEVTVWGADFDDLYWPSQPERSALLAAKQKLTSLGYLFDSSSSEVAKPKQSVDALSRLNKTSLCESFESFGADLRLTRMLDFARKQNSPEYTLTASWLAAWLEFGLDDPKLIVPNKLSDMALEPKFNSLSRLPSRVSKRLKRLLQIIDGKNASNNVEHFSRTDNFQIDDALIGILLAAAYPDRIAKNTQKRWKTSNGSAVEFHHSSQVSNSELIVVVDFHASQNGHYIQHYADLTVDQLSVYLPELIESKQVVKWSAEKQAPTALSVVSVGELILSQQNQKISFSNEQWQQVWCDYVKTNGIKSLETDKQLISSWLAKVALITKHKGMDFPVINETYLLDNLDKWFAPFVEQVRSVVQLKKLNLNNMLNSNLQWSEQQILKECCPSHFKTPAGTQVRIDYMSSPPKISVRMQEMFGEPQSPAICHGQQPLLIELLSPAQRPLQVTQDLGHFWQNAYKEVKKEMKGRYPKHRWPENPETELAGHSLKKKMPSN